jgi:hypothetical protein
MAPAPGGRGAYGHGQSAVHEAAALLAVSPTAWDDEAADPVGYDDALAALADPDIKTASVPGWDAARRTRRTAREAVEDRVACCGLAYAAGGDRHCRTVRPAPRPERGAAASGGAWATS